MNRNSKYKKIVAVATAASLVVTSLVGCNSNTANNSTAKAPESTKTPTATDAATNSSTATRDGEAAKEETVYVKANASGTTNSIIVSNWLKNGNGSTVIDDISNLKDIVNVKGDETFTADGANLNWAANGADIYYQGTSTEQLPVDLKITYTLDDKEIAPEELAGKSGHVKIRMDYTNNQKQTITVAGKKVDTVVPFAVLGGMLLDSEKFTNVTVTNGKVISDGNNTIVAGIALPGLQDTLIDGSSELVKDIELPGNIEMEADVTDFELSMTMSVVLNDLFKDVDVDNMGSIDDLKDTLDEMTKSYDKIVDGAKELSGYMGDLVSGVDQLADGGSQLKEGSPKINSAIKDLADGTKDAKDGSGVLLSGSKKLSDGANTLKGYTAQVAGGVDTVKTSIDKLVTAYEGDQGLKAGAKGVSDGAAAVDSGVTQLNTSLDGMYAQIDSNIQENQTKIDGLTKQAARLQTLAAKQAAGTITVEELQELAQLAPQADTIKTNIAALTGANEALKTIKKQLDDGKLMDKVDELNAGTTTLKNGAKQVSGGVDQMYGANLELQKGLVTLKTGADGVNSGAVDLATNLKTLYTGVKKLDAGLKTIDNGCSQFKTALLTYTQGVDKLNEGLVTLQSSSKQLEDGAKTLYDGTKEFKEKAIDKLSDAVNNNFDVLKEKITALVKADQSYTTFSGVNEKMSSNVKFIIETDAIEKK